MQEDINPKATPQPAQTQETVSLNHSISLKGINEKDLQILIAEDNDSNYSLVKHILKEYQITRVVNGVEATENQELNPIIPIIALTANAFDADRVSAMEAGCNAFLTKPLKKKNYLNCSHSSCNNITTSSLYSCHSKRTSYSYPFILYPVPGGAPTTLPHTSR